MIPAHLVRRDHAWPLQDSAKETDVGIRWLRREIKRTTAIARHRMRNEDDFTYWVVVYGYQQEYAWALEARQPEPIA